jgi:hypothetical protein
LEQARQRHGKRGREGRSRLLDEVCELCGYERKYVIKVLSGKRAIVGSRKRGARPATSSRSHWTHVPQLVGYARLEDPRAAELLNELYAKEWGWFRNFFCPVMKHLRTELEGSRKRRVYDAPATPFQRLKACRTADKEQITALENLYRTLDPFALKDAHRDQAARRIALPNSDPVLQSGLSARANPACSQTGSSGLSASARTLSLRGSGCRYLACRRLCTSLPGVLLLRQRIAIYFDRGVFFL